MCRCNNLIFNPFHMKHKVEDYNFDPSVKLILSSKCTRYKFVMDFGVFVSENVDENKESLEKKKESISVEKMKNIYRKKKKRKRKRLNKDTKKVAQTYETYWNEKLHSHLQLQGFIFSLKNKLSNKNVTKPLSKSNKLLFKNWSRDPTFEQDRCKFYSIHNVTVFFGHIFSFNSKKPVDETSYKWV